MYRFLGYICVYIYVCVYVFLCIQFKYGFTSICVRLYICLYLYMYVYTAILKAIQVAPLTYLGLT